MSRLSDTSPVPAEIEGLRRAGAGANGPVDDHDELDVLAAASVEGRRADDAEVRGTARPA